MTALVQTAQLDSSDCCFFMYVGSVQILMAVGEQGVKSIPNGNSKWYLYEKKKKRKPYLMLKSQKKF